MREATSSQPAVQEILNQLRNTPDGQKDEVCNIWLAKIVKMAIENPEIMLDPSITPIVNEATDMLKGNYWWDVLFPPLISDKDQEILDRVYRRAGKYGPMRNKNFLTLAKIL